MSIDLESIPDHNVYTIMHLNVPDLFTGTYPIVIIKVVCKRLNKDKAVITFCIHCSKISYVLLLLLLLLLLSLLLLLLLWIRDYGVLFLTPATMSLSSLNLPNLHVATYIIPN